jgi:tRNA (cmo5U34)-methyltransferase
LPAHVSRHTAAGFGSSLPILRMTPGARESRDRSKALFPRSQSIILDDDRKRELYREILDRLTPGGFFLNNDIVAQPLALKPQYETLMRRAIQDQDRIKRGRERPPEDIQAEMREQLRLASEDHHSHIAALRDQLRWLEEAGFKSVECHWKYLDFAVFGGVKE